MKKERMIVGISGASGAPIAVELLRALQKIDTLETCLVVTDGGERTLQHETGIDLQQLFKLADVTYDKNDVGAGPASGSFQHSGMIVVPCSMKTAAGIASGFSDNLLLRAADVTLKEKRKLVLVARECPLSPIHLRNMYELSQMGAVILPPMLSYYNHPITIEDATRHIIGKILDTFGIYYENFNRWEG